MPVMFDNADSFDKMAEAVLNTGADVRSTLRGPQHPPGALPKLQFPEVYVYYGGIPGATMDADGWVMGQLVTRNLEAIPNSTLDAIVSNEDTGWVYDTTYGYDNVEKQVIKFKGINEGYLVPSQIYKGRLHGTKDGYPTVLVQERGIADLDSYLTQVTGDGTFTPGFSGVGTVFYTLTLPNVGWYRFIWSFKGTVNNTGAGSNQWELVLQYYSLTGNSFTYGGTHDESRVNHLIWGVGTTANPYLTYNGSILIKCVVPGTSDIRIANIGTYQVPLTINDSVAPDLVYLGV